MTDLEELLKTTFDLNDEQIDKLNIYMHLLQEESTKYNLTSITDEEAIYIKHFYDCLSLTKYIDSDKNILDIGSGAGFPGLVLAIANPTYHLTLLEPTSKRCYFLNLVKNKLNLNNVEVVCDRAEIYIKEKRASFDVVTSRAVAALPIILELSIPYLKEDGFALLMKGKNLNEELEISKNALNALSSKVVDIYEVNLPCDEGSHYLLKIEKFDIIKDIYPRKYNQIIKKPL